MQFNSLTFIVFAGLFFATWPLLKRRNSTRWLFLVTASFIFYGWWDWRFLFLIIGSGLIDFFVGLAMSRFPSRRKLCLILSICGNVGSLAIFKYLDFGIGNLNWLLRAFGIDSDIPAANLILPVGISFYTFQSMSYTIDIYRGLLKPTHNIFHFFAYLSLFPQLVAGPIVRAKDLLPQLETVRDVSPDERWDGLNLIVFGFFKKVVVADTLAATVNTAFGPPELAASSCYWWIVMMMFSFQIYCDFSGYSDIARGLGKWMGYDFPVNFRNPYIASSFQEFWQRWHISLSTWFRDYVYLPLGGSHRGVARNQVNLWITMLISGLWHGAAWHFIFWAIAHSFYLTVERFTAWPDKLKRLPAGRHLATLAVFVLTILAWVFFRAQDFGQAIAVFRMMFDFGNFNFDLADQLIDNNASNVLLIIMGVQLLFYFGMDKGGWTTSRSRGKLAFDSIFIGVLIMVCVFMRAPSNIFIYFQF